MPHKPARFPNSARTRKISFQRGTLHAGNPSAALRQKPRPPPPPRARIGLPNLFHYTRGYSGSGESNTVSTNPRVMHCEVFWKGSRATCKCACEIIRGRLILRAWIRTFTNSNFLHFTVLILSIVLNISHSLWEFIRMLHGLDLRCRVQERLVYWGLVERSIF